MKCHGYMLLVITPTQIPNQTTINDNLVNNIMNTYTPMLTTLEITYPGMGDWIRTTLSIYQFIMSLFLIHSQNDYSNLGVFNILLTFITCIFNFAFAYIKIIFLMIQAILYRDTSIIAEKKINITKYVQAYINLRYSNIRESLLANINRDGQLIAITVLMFYSWIKIVLGINLSDSVVLIIVMTITVFPKTLILLTYKIAGFFNYLLISAITLYGMHQYLIDLIPDN